MLYHNIIKVKRILNRFNKDLNRFRTTFIKSRRILVLILSASNVYIDIHFEASFVSYNTFVSKQIVDSGKEIQLAFCCRPPGVVLRNST